MITDPLFLKYVNKTDTCWEWIGYKTKLGYGKFTRNKKSWLAHRFSYQLAGGLLNPELTLDHLCKNPSCVNPDHLEQVTQGENTRRSNSISSICARKTHCHKGHPYSGYNLILDLKRKERRCRICTNEKNIRKNLRKKQKSLGLSSSN